MHALLHFAHLVHHVHHAHAGGHGSERSGRRGATGHAGSGRGSRGFAAESGNQQFGFAGAAWFLEVSDQSVGGDGRGVAGNLGERIALGQQTPRRHELYQVPEPVQRIAPLTRGLVDHAHRHVVAQQPLIALARLLLQPQAPGEFQRLENQLIGRALEVIAQVVQQVDHAAASSGSRPARLSLDDWHNDSACCHCQYDNYDWLFPRRGLCP